MIKILTTINILWHCNGTQNMFCICFAVPIIHTILMKNNNFINLFCSGGFINFLQYFN